MSTEEIEQGNKLIAEFLGIPKCSRCTDCGAYQYGTAVFHFPAYMSYHRSWSWIMPVVEKLNEMNYPVTIYRGCVEIDTEWQWNTGGGTEYRNIVEINKTDEINLIQMVWYAVVEFLEWYNKEHSNQLT